VAACCCSEVDRPTWYSLPTKATMSVVAFVNIVKKHYYYYYYYYSIVAWRGREASLVIVIRTGLSLHHNKSTSYIVVSVFFVYKTARVYSLSFLVFYVLFIV